MRAQNMRSAHFQVGSPARGRRATLGPINCKSRIVSHAGGAFEPELRPACANRAPESAALGARKSRERRCCCCCCRCRFCCRELRASGAIADAPADPKRPLIQPGSAKRISTAQTRPSGRIIKMTIIVGQLCPVGSSTNVFIRASCGTKKACSK